MPEYVTVFEQIERRTYLKGFLTVKFAGTLDAANSDLKIENFYDVEITEADLRVARKDFRPWQTGDEFEEFCSAERFLSRLPAPLRCAVEEEDGSVKHYLLSVFEPKIINYRLFNQLYEKDELFVTLEGELSGYLRHYDTEEKLVEIVPPEPNFSAKNLSPENSVNFPSQAPQNAVINSEYNTAPNLFSRSGAYQQNHDGCAPRLGCGVLPGGCLSVLGGILIAYLIFAFVLLIISAIANIFTGIGAIVLPFYVSVIFPLLFVGLIFYAFARLQKNLSSFWRIFFRLIIILFIFLLWFNK